MSSPRPDYNRNRDEDQHPTWSNSHDRNSPPPAAGPSRGRSRSPVRSNQGRDRSRSPRERRSRSPPRPEDENPGTNLFVSNISSRVNEAALTDFFSQCGPVANCHIMKDPHTRDHRGFGFITMERADDAKAAIEKITGQDLEGRTIRVELARRGRPRTPTPGRYQGPTKSFATRRDVYGPSEYGGSSRDRYDPRYEREYEPRYRGGGGGYDRPYDRGFERDFPPPPPLPPRGGRPMYAPEFGPPPPHMPPPMPRDRFGGYDAPPYGFDRPPRMDQGGRGGYGAGGYERYDRR